MARDLSGFSGNLARNGIDRRQVIKVLGKGLGIAASAALAGAVAPQATSGPLAQRAAQTATAAGGGFKAIAYNHINYQVPDYAKVRDFHINLFGMKPVWDDGKQCSVEFGDPPNIYVRPLTQPLDRPAGEGRGANWAAQMGNGNVDHFAFSIRIST